MRPSVKDTYRRYTTILTLPHKHHQPCKTNFHYCLTFNLQISQEYALSNYKPCVRTINVCQVLKCYLGVGHEVSLLTTYAIGCMCIDENFLSYYKH